MANPASPEAKRKQMPIDTINQTYKLVKRLGSGSFGDVFKAVNLKSKSQKDFVAVKIEDARVSHPQLVYESKILNLLRGPGITRVYFSGQQGDYNVLVMDLLGPPLEDLVAVNHGTFSLKTTLMLADQILQRIEYVHSKGFLHRDVKPENFCIGTQTLAAGGAPKSKTGDKGAADKGGKGPAFAQGANMVFIIDFGLSKRYIDPKTKEHMPYRDNKSLTGTARYASINAHRGVEQSRRDDLEAIGHMLLYFLKGQLPWQGLPARTKEEKYRKIKEKKVQTSIADLCAGLPDEFATYMNYVRGLRFTDRPDYSYLRGLFADRFQSEGYEFDYQFDWVGKVDADPGTGGDREAAPTRKRGGGCLGLCVPDRR